MPKLTECFFCHGEGKVFEYQYREEIEHECIECDGLGRQTVVAYNESYASNQAMNAAILDADLNW
jgi:DnaJ-class molecular chaperone